MGSNAVIGSMGVKTGGTLKDQLSPQVGLRPVSLASAANGLAIEKKGYGAALVTMKTGVVTGAPSAVDVDVKVQESATSGGTYADVNASTQRGDAAVAANIADDAASGEVTFLVDLGGVELDFIRVVVTPNFTGGSSPEILTDVIVVLGAKTSAKDISTDVALY